MAGAPPVVAAAARAVASRSLCIHCTPRALRFIIPAVCGELTCDVAETPWPADVFQDIDEMQAAEEMGIGNNGLNGRHLAMLCALLFLGTGVVRFEMLVLFLALPA